MIQSKMKSCLDFAIGTLNFLKIIEDLDSYKVIRIFVWLMKNLSNLLMKIQDKSTTDQEKLLLKNYILSLDPHEVQYN